MRAPTSGDGRLSVTTAAVVAGLAAAVLIATVGDEVTMVATTLTTALASASTAQVSGLMVAATVPSIVLAPWLGRLVDRVPVQRVLPAAALLAAGVAGTLRWVSSPWLTITLIGVLGVAAAVASTAIVATVPVLARRAGRSVTRIGAALEVVRSGSFLLAPPVAALLVSTISYPQTVTVIAGAYLLAALVFWVVLTTTQVPETDVDVDESAPHDDAGRLLGGFSALISGSRLRLPLAAVTVAVAGSAVFDVLLVFFVTHDLDLGAGAYGTLLAAWSAGLLLGPLLTRLMPEDDGSAAAARRAVIFAVVHVASFGVSAALVQTWVTYVAFVIGGASNALQNIYMRTAVLEGYARWAVGSVVAAYIAVLQTGSVIGLLLAGLVPATQARPALIASSLVAAVLALVALALTARAGRVRS